jgi:hypothetical protein
MKRRSPVLGQALCYEPAHRETMPVEGSALIFVIYLLQWPSEIAKIGDSKNCLAIRVRFNKGCASIIWGLLGMNRTEAFVCNTTNWGSMRKCFRNEDPGRGYSWAGMPNCRNCRDTRLPDGRTAVRCGVRIGVWDRSRLGDGSRRKSEIDWVTRGSRTTSKLNRRQSGLIQLS